MTRVRQPLFMPSCSGEQVVLAPRLRRDAGEELLAAAHGAAARPRAGGSPRTATARRARGSSRPSPARDVGVLDVQRVRAVRRDEVERVVDLRERHHLADVDAVDTMPSPPTSAGRLQRASQYRSARVDRVEMDVRLHIRRDHELPAEIHALRLRLDMWRDRLEPPVP